MPFKMEPLFLHPPPHPTGKSCGPARAFSLVPRCRNATLVMAAIAHDQAGLGVEKVNILGVEPGGGEGLHGGDNVPEKHRGEVNHRKS